VVGSVLRNAFGVVNNDKKIRDTTLVFMESVLYDGVRCILQRIVYGCCRCATTWAKWVE
jgi:hypothetical protein